MASGSNWGVKDCGMKDGIMKCCLKFPFLMPLSSIYQSPPTHLHLSLAHLFSPLYAAFLLTSVLVHVCSYFPFSSLSLVFFFLPTIPLHLFVVLFPLFSLFHFLFLTSFYPLASVLCSHIFPSLCFPLHPLSSHQFLSYHIPPLCFLSHLLSFSHFPSHPLSSCTVLHTFLPYHHHHLFSPLNYSLPSLATHLPLSSITPTSVARSSHALLASSAPLHPSLNNNIWCNSSLGLNLITRPPRPTRQTLRTQVIAAKSTVIV